MSTPMGYETIECRDKKLTSRVGKLCADIRDNGYMATYYGGPRAGSFRVELSKTVGRRRTALGQLHVNVFGPLITMGHVPKDIRDLCAKFVVP